MSDLRFVVDDSSLVFEDLSDSELEDAMAALCQQIQSCRDQDERVGIISEYDLIECRPSIPLHALLSDASTSRDRRNLTYRLLDKCERIDRDPDFFIEPVVLVNDQEVESYGLALVAQYAHLKRSLGALALNPTAGPGRITITDSQGSCAGYVITTGSSRCIFYRSIYGLENVQEAKFFELAVLAFSKLRFADDLNFRKFAGSYSVRDVVVEHLGALNDGFRRAYEAHNGLPDAVSAELGIDLSFEGGTRQSERLMRLRDVDFRGRTYRCEWHSKLEPHRNRIHIHYGDEATDDCVLIGLFVEHLPT